MNLQPQAKAPNYLVRRVVGWQASRISDPVARLSFLRRTVGDRRLLGSLPPGQSSRWRRRGLGLTIAVLALALPAAHYGLGDSFRRPSEPVRAATGNLPPKVWLVEQNKEFETWSNGLRIERRFETTSDPRSYSIFRRGQEDTSAPLPAAHPAGIVFHTTESLQVPFDEHNRKQLTYLGEALLRFIQREKCYHYVIDRFGRAWRIVRDEDAAWHAGQSVWADASRTFVGLNHSFLGISLEAETEGIVSGRAQATPAQIRTLAVLTEALRSRYSIPADLCVTHAQVSVSLFSKGVGYHTDWAAHFPYAAVGLPDNYAIPSPAVALFGFNYDSDLVHKTGEPFWKGLLLGEDRLRQDAAAHGMAPPAYRLSLVERYRRVVNTLKQRSEEAKEKQG